jgi:WD40 repeat protein
MENLNSQNDALGSTTGPLAGRNRQVFDILSLFQSSQMVGLFGEMGSGKTTLIKKGLIPELEKGFLGIAGRKWKSVTIRPGITPLENLSAGIAQLGLNQGKQKLEDEVFLTESMRLSNEGLKNACLQKESQKSDFNALLVIDNFEDLFEFREVSQNTSEWDEIVKSFIQNITKCASYSSIPVYFLIVLRAEYMSRLFEYRHFYEIVSASQYNLPQFRKTEFTEVIKAILQPSKMTMHKDGVDYLYNELGKDLKNLTLLKYFLNEAVETTATNSKEEIALEVLLQISSGSLYAKKLELFFSTCSEVKQRLIEKLFKQITVTEEVSRLSKPIRVDHFLKVTGSQLQELSPLLQSIQHSFPFLLDVLLPFQERLEVKNHSLISVASVIDVKNEQFIPHWPRLVEWIKEEKESQDLYKRLSEKSMLFDKGLTDYMKPPDLDLALSWYEQQKPDELWSNQFDSNHHRTIAYLLTSKVKFQDEISKKELDQKNKIKSLYKWASIIGVGVVLVVTVVFVLYLNAENQKTLAQKQREIAFKETEKAKKEKIRADAAREDAIEATDEALKNEQLAKIQKLRADEEKNKAQEATNYALEQQKIIKKSNDELNLKEKELKINVANLVVSDSLKAVATKQAQNARNYQETLNAVLILRNQVQKKDYQADELQKLLKEVDLVYSNYKKATLEFKEANLPNNDLYQVMLDIRKKLLDQGTIDGIPTDLYSMKSGLRKIRVSSSGTIAAGGDDGELLYSKQALGQGPVALTKSVPFRGDRIRSLDFLNDKDLIIGTVNGKLHQFNTATGVNKPLEVGLVANQIVEQVVVASKVAFLLVGGEVMKVMPSDLSKTTKVANLSAKNLFKFNEEKLLVVSKDNTLVLLDVASLQWQPLATDLKKNTITAAFSSGGNLFLGMEDGQIAICKALKLGNVISVKTDLIIQPHRTRITSLAFDASSNKLFSASLDQTANIFDLNLKKVNPDYVGIHNFKIEGFDKWIWDFALVQTGKVKTLLTVDESGELKSWQTGAEVLYDELFSSSNK